MAAPTSSQPVARVLPRGGGGGFRAFPESAPASLRFSVGRRRAARLGPPIEIVSPPLVWVRSVEFG